MTPRVIWWRVYKDFLMPSRLHLYRNLLQTALREGYQVCSVSEVWQMIQEGFSGRDGKYMVLRHDVDTDPGTAGRMWRIARELGVTGSFFFRLSTLDLDLMHEIAAGGWEVSYHYEEAATVAKRHRLRTRAAVLEAMPRIRDLFRTNLESLRRRSGLPMTVVASHGDFANRRLNLTNRILLKDRAFRREVGIDLEVYDDEFMGRMTSRHADGGDPRSVWPASESPLRAVSDGARLIHVLVHPRHFYANRRVNLVDDVRRLWEGVRYSGRIR